MKLLLRSLLLFSFGFTSLSFAIDSTTAKEKYRTTWEAISANPYKVFPQATSPGGVGTYHLFCSAFTAQVFEPGDVMPENREKHIHGSGTNIGVSFISNKKHGYTGMLNKGASFGIMRLSLATAAEISHFVPGLAIKFFISDHESENVFAMPTLTGQTQNNLFAHDFTTVLPDPPKSWSLEYAKLWMLNKRFDAGLSAAGFVNGDNKGLKVDGLAAVTEDGVAVEDYNAPYQLIFRPTEEAKLLFERTCPRRDFREILKDKGMGLTLFTVFAKKTAHAEEEEIGEIRTLTGFCASQFGDETIRFQHPAPHDLDDRNK